MKNSLKWFIKVVFHSKSMATNYKKKLQVWRSEAHLDIAII